MPTLGAPLDLAKYEARNLRAHILGAAPSSPVTGQLYYNTSDNTLYWWNGTTWVAAQSGAAIGDATTTTKGIVQLAGDLTGTATNPQIAAGVITDADVNPANKDGATGTASMRTLGNGAQQAMPGNYRHDQIAAPTAPVAWGSQRLTNLGDPSAGTDGANKQYVDGVAQGLDAKQSVRVATTANLTRSGLTAIDGVTPTGGDRILVKDQTSPTENGIYVAAAGAWTRATDADTWSEVVSAFVFVEQGSANADSGWVCTVDTGGTIDSTPMTWTQFSGAGQITAGNGLTKLGNTLDVQVDGATIEIAADTLRVKDGGITNAKVTSIDAGTKLTNATPITNGGTGQTTAKTGREAGLGAAGYYTSSSHGAGTTISVPQSTHGLRSSKGLLVQVQDEASGAVELPDIVVNATGDVTVTYGVSVSANSKRVTVIG